MCGLKEQILLSGENDKQVNWCTCCNRYSLYYNDFFFSFSEEEFGEFFDVLLNLTELDFRFYLKNKEQVMIRNLAANSGIFLSKKEVSGILTLINIAEMMNTVHAIIRE